MQPTTLTALESSTLGSSRLRRTIIVWQSCVRVLFAPFVKQMNLGMRVDFVAQDLEPGVRYIVASNHQSALDSFIYLTIFTPSVFRRLRPFRAMTLNPYFDRPLIKWGAIFMGCFPARAHHKYPSGTTFAGELLSGPQTVFICPEGGRTLPGTKPARPGVAKLALLPNVMIIPAHIQWYHTGVLRRSFRLTLGRPMDASQMTAQAILDHIYALKLP
jgi:1-acyl-sn-glycerol-3-phosphate acyltransferase